MGRRERNLWILASVLVAAVYSTLGVTRDLAAELGARALIDDLFFAGAMALMVALILIGFRARWRGIEVGIVLGALAVLTLVSLRMTVPERTHLVEYGVIAIVVFEALFERSDRPVVAGILAALLTTSAGALDEVIQSLVPGRVFDPIDIAFNGVAAVVTVGCAASLRAIAARRR